MLLIHLSSGYLLLHRSLVDICRPPVQVTDSHLWTNSTPTTTSLNGGGNTSTPPEHKQKFTGLNQQDELNGGAGATICQCNKELLEGLKVAAEKKKSNVKATLLLDLTLETQTDFLPAILAAEKDTILNEGTNLDVVSLLQILREYCYRDNGTMVVHPMLDVLTSKLSKFLSYKQNVNKKVAADCIIDKTKAHFDALNIRRMDEGVIYANYNKKALQTIDKERIHY
eukprot:jgi/Psemu1/50397/gm1.50397_g